MLAAEPIAELTQVFGEAARFVVNGKTVDQDANVWVLWRRVSERIGAWPTGPQALGPGWIGYVGFEAAGQLERLPQSHPPDLGLPPVRMGLFDLVLVHDGVKQQTSAIEAVGLAERLHDLGATLSKRQDDWIERWTAGPNSNAIGKAAIELPPVEVEIEHSRWAYDHMVGRALDYIAAGDIYQVNLCQRLRLTGLTQPFERYLNLRTHNPAPYGGFISLPEGCVLSASPELFLEVRGREVLTRPIKGTRPRTGDADQDAVYRQELLASEKDAAELAMIIDLHRNDLGRVCEYGSIVVENARRVEAHARVWHTLADIRGRLAAGRGALDLLAASFPAGSISGVPKIRALEIIDELEPVARGVYTGAIGALGLDGQMTMSVAIRIVQCGPGGAALYVGGGIVADSDPDAEYEETLAKARGVLEGLGARPTVEA